MRLCQVRVDKDPRCISEKTLGPCATTLNLLYNLTSMNDPYKFLHKKKDERTWNGQEQACHNECVEANRAEHPPFKAQSTRQPLHRPMVSQQLGQAIAVSYTHLTLPTKLEV